MTTEVFPGITAGTWDPPAGATKADFEMFAAGGGGGAGNIIGGGGGGGGSYALVLAVSVITGTTWDYTCFGGGGGGSGGDGNKGGPAQVNLTGGSTILYSYGGKPGKFDGSGGVSKDNYYGDVKYIGGKGATVSSSTGGGGGGSSGGRTSVGNDGQANVLTTGGYGGAAPSGGYAGAGGNGGSAGYSGNYGLAYGGGGGGGSAGNNGGNGAPSAVIISYTLPSGQPTAKRFGGIQHAGINRNHGNSGSVKVC